MLRGFETIGPAFWHYSLPEFELLLQQAKDVLAFRAFPLMSAMIQGSRRRRERALYKILNDSGDLATRYELPKGSLTQNQELLPTQEFDLFEHLERRNAFQEFWDGQYSVQMWALLRAAGFAYEVGEGGRGSWKVLAFSPLEVLHRKH